MSGLVSLLQFVVQAQAEIPLDTQQWIQKWEWKWNSAPEAQQAAEFLQKYRELTQDDPAWQIGPGGENGNMNELEMGMCLHEIRRWGIVDPYIVIPSMLGNYMLRDFGRKQRADKKWTWETKSAGLRWEQRFGRAELEAFHKAKTKLLLCQTLDAKTEKINRALIAGGSKRLEQSTSVFSGWLLAVISDGKVKQVATHPMVKRLNMYERFHQVIDNLHQAGDLTGPNPLPTMGDLLNIHADASGNDAALLALALLYQLDMKVEMKDVPKDIAAVRAVLLASYIGRELPRYVVERNRFAIWRFRPSETQTLLQWIKRWGPGRNWHQSPEYKVMKDYVAALHHQFRFGNGEDVFEFFDQVTGWANNDMVAQQLETVCRLANANQGGALYNTLLIQGLKIYANLGATFKDEIPVITGKLIGFNLAPGHFHFLAMDTTTDPVQWWVISGLESGHAEIIQTAKKLQMILPSLIPRKLADGKDVKINDLVDGFSDTQGDHESCGFLVVYWAVLFSIFKTSPDDIINEAKTIDRDRQLFRLDAARAIFTAIGLFSLLKERRHLLNLPIPPSLHLFQDL